MGDASRRAQEPTAARGAARAPEPGDDGDSTPTRAGLQETHTAYVFFVGERAYKCKKPVDLGFLDHTTVAARRRTCARELALNRRFAPDVYLGLAEFRGHDATEPEPVLVMRRMATGRRLSALVREGSAIEEPLRAVARQLAGWHARAPRGPQIDAQGDRDAVAARWAASFAEVAREPAAPEEVPEVERLVRRYLAGRRRLFDLRVAQRRLVDGHGDLLAEDVFCLPDGPRILDCLEFDDQLRYVDGLDDAAFLAMDLEHLGAPDAARVFLRHYSEFSGDPGPPSLCHHYVAYRAFVRAKVSLVQARQGASGARAAARRLMATAAHHLRSAAVGLTLVGGLPGSGKSTLAGALADRLGATLLSSDRVRKELAGVPADHPATAGYGEGLYTPEWTARTYATLLERAGTLLATGESVVLDATWVDAAQRAAARDVAERATADLVALRCQAPQEVAAARLRARSGGVSDADAQIAENMAAAEAPWPEATTVDTSGALQVAVAQALAAVRPSALDRDPPPAPTQRG